VVISSDWSGQAGHGFGAVVARDGRYFFRPASTEDNLLITRTLTGAPSSPVAEGLYLPALLFMLRASITGRTVLLILDNLPLVQAINKRDSQTPGILHIIETLTRIEVICDTQLFVVWTDTTRNRLADDVSRTDFTSFRAVFEQICERKSPTNPEVLVPLPAGWESFEPKSRAC